MSFVAQVEEIAHRVMARVRQDAAEEVADLKARVEALEAKMSGGGDVVETAAKAPRARSGRAAKTDTPAPEPAGEPEAPQDAAAKTDGK